MPAITIIGPNLPHHATPNGEAFIAHAAGCRDIARTLSRHDAAQPRTIEADTFVDVAVAIYEDMIDEGSMSEDDAVADVHFCPCCELL
jgi:hypothetical protein